MRTIFKQFQFLGFVVIMAFVVNACSSDDNRNNDNEIDPEAEVFQGQFVTLELSREVSQQEYEAVLGGLAITVSKIDSSKLMFYVPADFPVGDTDFHISELNTNVNYLVKESLLTDSADIALAPLFTEINTISQEIEAEETEQALYLKQVFASFDSYYEGLSQQEKDQMALFYHTNAELFNSILNPNFAEGRWAGINTTLLKHKIATLAFGAGVAVVWLAPTPLDKSAGALVAIIGWKKSRDYLSTFVNSKVKTVEVMFNDLFSGKPAGKTMDNPATFIHNITKNIPFSVDRRDVVSGDNSGSTSGIVTFFGSHTIFSNAVTTLNDVIAFVNDNVFFLNIPSVPVYTMPSENSVETIALNSDYLQNLSFSVANSNVQLTVGNLDENGNLSLKFTLLNPDAGNINTALDYTYSDEYSSFSGSVPVEVKVEEEVHLELTGIWHLKNSQLATGLIIQIDEIDFQNGGDGLILRTYRDPELFPQPEYAGWHDSNFEYGYGPFIVTQNYNATTSVLTLSQIYFHYTYQFPYDSQSSIILPMITDSNKYELIKQ